MKIKLTLILTMATALFHIGPAAADNVNGGLALAIEPLIQGPPQPTGLHYANDGTGRLFILTKDGTIRIFDGTQLLSAPFLDIRDRVVDAGVERGLHGLVFDPDYTSNGYFYVTYTDLASDSVLARYSVTADANVADYDSEQILLMIDQPDQYHNVSQLQFGPDGYLYIGAGDGGFVGDPNNHAQNLGQLLGKILRLDVHGAFPYESPPDNPFIGVPGARPEIWAYGVRNPWRFSFDRLTGDMFMGDVGQFAWEEVNFQPAASTGGENYGWRMMEGNHCYNPSSGCMDPSFTQPILEYAHGFGAGCAVIGGYRYRGARFPRLAATYFYADWCEGKIWGAQESGGAWTTTQLLNTTLVPTTFGQDASGELILADSNNGMIYRLYDPLPFCDARLSQSVYGEGDTVAIQSLRLLNLGDTPVPGRVQVILRRPGLPASVLIDVGQDGSFVVAPGTDLARGPINLFTVGPETTPGTYRLMCRLTDPGTGSVLYLDRNRFTVQ